MLTGCVPWPPEFGERYRRAGYWRGERLGDVTRRWAREAPSRIALVCGDRALSYAELDARADRLASGLRRLGLRPHDRAVVQLPNVPEFVIVSLALFRLGVVPVFALASHRRHEIAYLCVRTGAAAYFAVDRLYAFDFRALAREVVAEAPTVRHVIVAGDAAEFTALASLDDDGAPEPPPDPEDAAFLLLSGGTTGLPKLIPRTHDDYAYQIRATAEALGVNEQSAYLAALPIAHNAALGCPGVLGTLRAGGRVVLSASPSPTDAFPLIARERVTHTTLISPLVRLWVESVSLLPVDLSSLVLQIGGAKLDPDLGRELRPRLGCMVTQWFGMGEGILCYTRLTDPEDVALGTQGRPVCADDEVRVVDEHDQDVDAGSVGELLVRGPYTIRGYYREDAYNAGRFTNDGFLRTADLVRIDAGGNLVVEGRLTDVINRGGEKIAPGEVEDLLTAHPAIHQAALVSVPDRMLGERTCAFVVSRDASLTLAGLKTFLGARGLAHFKMPDRLEIVDVLPRTPLGKIDRAALRALPVPA
jgi:2,3-dihydroxybenzoate-AMP ligase